MNDLIGKTTKAFHPQTMGVMYDCVINKIESDTITVRFTDFMLPEKNRKRFKLSLKDVEHPETKELLEK